MLEVLFMSCNVIIFAGMEYKPVIKGNILMIDLGQWTTQLNKSNDGTITLNTLSQQIKRAKEGKSGSKDIDYMEIPQLNGLTLVKK